VFVFFFFFILGFHKFVPKFKQSGRNSRVQKANVKCIKIVFLFYILDILEKNKTSDLDMAEFPRQNRRKNQSQFCPLLSRFIAYGSKIKASGRRCSNLIRMF